MINLVAKHKSGELNAVLRQLLLVYSVYVILKTHHITRNQIKTVSNMNMGKYSCQSSSTLLSVPKILPVPLQGEHSY